MTIDSFRQNVRPASWGVILGGLLLFAALANGAHDIWAATLVYELVTLLFVVTLFRSSWAPPSAGLSAVGLILSLLVIIAFSVSHFFSICPEESYLELMDWICSLLIFIVAQNIFKSDVTLDWFVRTVSPLFLIEAGMAILQKLGYGPGVLEEAPAGTFLNANFSTAFHLLWAPIVYAQWELKRREFKKIPIYWSLIGIALLINLVLASSASGLLCLILGLPCLIWRDQIGTLIKKHPRWIFIWVGIFLLMGGLVGIYKYALLYRGAYHGPYLAPTSRLTWWMSAVHMWKDRPWWGLGPGTYGKAYLAYKIGVGQNTLYAHSAPLALLSETGVLGFLAVVLLTVRIFLPAKQSGIMSSPRFPYFMGLALFVLFSLINISYELLVNLMSVAFFAGAMVSLSPGPAIKIGRSILLTIGAVGLVSVVFILSPFVASQNVVAGEQELIAEHFPAAQDDFDHAIALDPNSEAAYRGLARIDAKEKKYDACIFNQTNAIKKNQLSGILWWELGQYFEGMNAPQKALSAYERALKLHHTNVRFRQDYERLRVRR